MEINPHDKLFAEILAEYD